MLSPARTRTWSLVLTVASTLGWGLAGPALAESVPQTRDYAAAEAAVRATRAAQSLNVSERWSKPKDKDKPNGLSAGTLKRPVLLVPGNKDHGRVFNQLTKYLTHNKANGGVAYYRAKDGTFRADKPNGRVLSKADVAATKIFVLEYKKVGAPPAEKVPQIQRAMDAIASARQSVGPSTQSAAARSGSSELGREKVTIDVVTHGNSANRVLAASNAGTGRAQLGQIAAVKGVIKGPAARAFGSGVRGIIGATRQLTGSRGAGVDSRTGLAARSPVQASSQLGPGRGAGPSLASSSWGAGRGASGSGALTAGGNGNRGTSTGAAFGNGNRATAGTGSAFGTGGRNGTGPGNGADRSFGGNVAGRGAMGTPGNNTGFASTGRLGTGTGTTTNTMRAGNFGTSSNSTSFGATAGRGGLGGTSTSFGSSGLGGSGSGFGGGFSSGLGLGGARR
jgi:hypothetical protein